LGGAQRLRSRALLRAKFHGLAGAVFDDREVDAIAHAVDALRRDGVGPLATAVTRHRDPERR
jgi:hypothetical protein